MSSEIIGTMLNKDPPPLALLERVHKLVADGCLWVSNRHSKSRPPRHGSRAWCDPGVIMTRQQSPATVRLCLRGGRGTDLLTTRQ